MKLWQDEAPGAGVRFARLLRGELRFALRYGIVPLYGLITVLYLVLLSLLAPEARPLAGGVTILTDPAAMGLFFMGAMLLLEKSQRVDCALAVTPVSAQAYVLAKAAALTGLGVAVSVPVAIASGLSAGGAAVAVLLGGALFSFLGMMLAFRSGSLNRFLLLSIPVELVAFVPPMFTWFGGASGALWLLHPGVAVLALFGSVGPLWPVAALSLLGWDAAAFLLCRRMAARYLTQWGGGRL